MGGIVSRSKGGKGSQPKSGKNSMGEMATDVLYPLDELLTREEAAKLSATNRHHNSFFTKDKRLAKTAPYLVLTGRPNYLIRLLARNPMLYFTPCAEVTDAVGQTFYNVSAADLVYFLCDDDMSRWVLRFAQELPTKQRTAFFTKWQDHQASRGQGGADLVFFTGNHPPEYARIKVRPGQIGESHLTRLLLQNPDGLVCWKNDEQPETWYYANPKKKTLELVQLRDNLSESDATQYEKLISSMKRMKRYTARRSSDEEHQLFQDLMLHKAAQQPITLVRQGIRYTSDGIQYIDTHHDFNRLINAYLKCIQLYNTNNPDEAAKVWREELGHEQKKIMWLVQTYCDRRLTFSSLSKKHRENLLQRSFEAFSCRADKKMQVFDVKRGCFVPGFGDADVNAGFALSRGAFNKAIASPMDRMWDSEHPSRVDVHSVVDFLVINQLYQQALLSIEAPIQQPKNLDAEASRPRNPK